MNIGALLQITQVCAMHVLQPQLPVVCSGFSLSELEHDHFFVVWLQTTCCLQCGCKQQVVCNVAAITLLFAVWLQSTCCLHEFATYAANAQLNCCVA